MEKQTRNHYTEEFKKRTVKFILEQTKTIPELALELDISAGVLHNWKRMYRSEFQAEIQAAPDRVRQLEQQLRDIETEKQKQELENADLREELEILKKALHIFGKERN